VLLMLQGHVQMARQVAQSFVVELAWRRSHQHPASWVQVLLQGGG
jgi:hypothetical protein